MTYKSNPLTMIAGFIKGMIVLSFVEVLLFGLLLMLLSHMGADIDVDAELFLKTSGILVGIAVIVTAWLSFYYNNIKVVVSGDAVRFFRGKKEYLNFPYASVTFTSYVHKTSYNFIPMSTSRYLRVVLGNDEKGSGKVIVVNGERVKDYKCHYFNRGTFENLMANIHLRRDELLCKAKEESAVPESRLSDISAAKSNDPHMFTINKHILINRYKKPFLILTLSFAAFILLLLIIQIATDRNLSDHIGFYVFFSVFMSVVLLPIPLFMFGIPLFKIKKRTPEIITIYDDRLSLDEQTFYFSQIKLIKATPPSYTDSATRILRRKITIDEGNRRIVFIVGDSRDSIDKKNKPKVFEDYGVFCNVLKEVLKDQPNKFIMELA